MEPVRPDYDGACVSGLVRGLRGRADWVPDVARDARAVVLLLVDGLGWELLKRHRALVPNMSQMDGGPITTVAPSTTTAALTSLTTGLTPAEHGIVGYRMLVDRDVLNVLRWTMKGVQAPGPETIQPRLAFNGEPVPVVTKAEFASTGFTSVHLRGARLEGWHSVSSIAVRCRRLVDDGERFVYAYYGNADIVFHMHGLGDEYLLAELSFVDRLVADLVDALPTDVAIVVTADHGHVDFEEWIEITELHPLIEKQTGEARFRYLHARHGAAAELAAAAVDRYSSIAWVRTKDELIEDGWLGATPRTEVRRRLGDVVLAAHGPVGFIDPANAGEARLRSGHGSLTRDEMLVPLLATRGAAGS